MIESKVLYRKKSDKPVLFKSASDIYIFNEQGEKFLDACSNSMNVNLGYSQARIVDSMVKQATILPFAHNKKGTTIVQEELAIKLTSLLTEENYSCFFCSNGSDAIETALRIAYMYQVSSDNLDKTEFVSWTESYHGSSLGALSVTGIENVFEPYDKFIKKYPKIMFPNCSNCTNECDKNGNDCKCLAELTPEIMKNTAGIVIDGMITNPVGSKMPPNKYLELLQKKCNDDQVVLIFDEIATSIGRTGRNFSFEHFNVRPDIICLSKGLGVGYANIGAVLVADHIKNALTEDKDILGHTFNGHPISCAVGLEVLDIIKEDGVTENVKEREKELKDYLDSIKHYPGIKEVNGKGLMYSLVFDRGYVPENFLSIVTELSMQNGLLLLSASTKRSMHITISPPLIIKKNQMDDLCCKLDKVIKKSLNSIK